MGIFVKAQISTADSLLSVLNSESDDSKRFLINYLLADYYEEWKIDSSLFFTEEAIRIAIKHDQKLAVAAALNTKGYQLSSKGNYGKSLNCLREAFRLLDDPGNETGSWKLPGMRSRISEFAYTHYMLGLLMDRTQNLSQELYHFNEALRISKSVADTFRTRVTLQNLTYTYIELNKPDSAMICAKSANSITSNPGDKHKGWQLHCLGWVYYKLGHLDSSKKIFHEGIYISRKGKNQECLLYTYSDLTRIYLQERNKDSSLYYAKLAMESFNYLGSVAVIDYNLGTIYELQYNSYKLYGQQDSANKYLAIALTTQDSLYETRIRNLADFQTLTFNEQLRLQDLEKERIENRSKLKTYSFIAGLTVLLIIAAILYRNNKQKQKANKVLEVTLSNLKATQIQLIHSEKMASLGELTAGIAHEIQNPLNFVNNFSDVNTELLIEMNEEIDKGNLNEVRSIVKDVIDNEEKINHHGKRADAIVKGMLQHSRKSSGQKEPTNINALADEYLRLSYHGLRAKDKLFNAEVKTDFDNSIGKINIIPQEIGRVILNLINNAFYAVHEKAKQNILGYQPTIVISTKKLPGKVEIKVQDNADGIPDSIKEKIFQPFFTTKPTGQGTGLGLSLSYDIVKAHGGEVKVETKEVKGSEFIIYLPA